MSHSELLAIAARYDTSMSRAMLRALGVPVRTPVPRSPQVVSEEAYIGMMECMANRRSPMDGRF